MSKTIKFVNKAYEINEGFSDEELNIILSELGIRNLIYINFLRKAGKKSNILDLEFKNVTEFISFQNNFRNILANNPYNKLETKNLCVINTTVDAFRNKYYYFIEADEEPIDPKVYYYSDGEIPIGENFRDDRTKKIGLVNTEKNFTVFINDKTTLKFGTAWWKKIPNVLILIVLSPLWLPFAFYTWIKTKF